jgi:uncharacterized protein (DUF1501 family)
MRNDSLGLALDRRAFLRAAGAGLACFTLDPLRALAQDAPTAPRRTLVVIFLRGGADGLSLVAPWADEDYRRLRPSLALGSPGSGDGSVLDLDGRFGLHPALGALRPGFDEGWALALQAVGHDRNTRSHFEEQDVWETGLVDPAVRAEGWLNRHLQSRTGRGPLRAVAVGDSLPRALHGRAPALAVRTLEDLVLPGDVDAEVLEAMRGAYAGSAAGAGPDDPSQLLARSAGATLDGVQELRALLGGDYTPGASYPQNNVLAQRLQLVARLIKADVGLEVAEVDYDGWDTHNDQAGPFNQLARGLGDAMAAFAADLGPRLDDVLLLTQSDFGRTAAENGTRGTDHGWGSCLLALGGPVARARTSGLGPVAGDFPGLAPDELLENRDLRHRIDFRDVLAEAVDVHLDNAPALPDVLPGHERRRVGYLA